MRDLDFDELMNTKYSCGAPLIEDIRKLKYTDQAKVMKAYHKVLAKDRYWSSDLFFERFGIDTKLYFFIIHFSKEYIKDTDGYRKIAIKTLGIEDKTLQNYTKDDAFADELLKYLPC